MKTFGRIVILLLLILMLPVAMEARAEDNQALEQEIIESYTYGRKIDISQYEIEVKALEKLFTKLYNRGDLPWYAMPDYYCVYDEETLLAETFEPRLYPDYKYDRAKYQQRLEEIYRECVIEGMSDWQIALTFHDYLIIHGYYDESLNERTGYDLLTNGKTVCSGYTEVYKALLTMAGIPCVNVVSEKMQHTWNLVKIGGKWYHVDVTWDDPTPDCYGLVTHKYFLVSDGEISSGIDRHYDWETDIKCSDNSFSTAFWRSVDSPIWFTDTDTCYLIRQDKYSNAIYRRTLSTGQETRIYKEADVFINIGKGSYRYRHFGLSIWNGRLWMGTMTQILSMDMDGKDVRVEFTYDAKKNKRFLAGFYVHKDYIRYLTGNHEAYESTYIQTLEATGYHVHKYTETEVAPTCYENGYTLSECSCGITCQSSPLYRLEHDFQETEVQQPTMLKDGVRTETCSHCGESRSESIPKLTFRERFDNATIGAIGGALVGVIVVIFMLIVRKIIRKNAKNYPTPQPPSEEPPQEEQPQEEPQQDEPPSNTAETETD